MQRSSLFMPTLVALLLAGCATPDARVAVAPLQPRALGLADVAAPGIDAEWWTALNDRQLDRIMQDALTGSPRLDTAMARVRQAQALIATRKADDLPQVTFDANEQRTRLSEKYIIPPPYGGSTRWMGQEQANLDWSLDFWGRQADAIAQARSTAQAAALDEAATRLTLTGSIAQTYIELARAERQIAIGKANVDQRDHALRLTRTQVASDLASQIDVRAAETLLAQARQAQVRAEGQRDLLIHALALLAGRGADYYATIQPTTIRLDAALPLPTLLPADLLSRRPDVLSARANIDAAAAGREVARKAFYPNINLQALAGVQALGLGNLFTSGAVTYGAGAALHLPIFEGGKLRAEHAAATARLDEAIATYNDRVLAAVRDAADALTRIASTRADLDEQRRALQGLSEVTRLNGVRVSTGLDSRLDLIGSDVRLLQAQLDQANLEAQSAIEAVRLLIAVGGGFQSPDDRISPTTSPASIAQ